YLGANPSMRISLDAVPDAEQQGPAFREDTPGFAYRAALVGQKHDPESTHHGAELPIIERQAGCVRLVPLDAATVAQPASREAQHRVADITADQATSGVEALAQESGCYAGTAGELENVAGRPAWKALREVRSKGVEPGGPQATVIVLGI